MPNHRNLWQLSIRGGVLLKARLDKGWTQRDLADRCTALGTQVDPSNISKGERSGKSLGTRKIAVILAVLPSISPAALIEDYSPEIEALIGTLTKAHAPATAASGLQQRELPAAPACVP
jgi:hypothetical protein